MSLFQTVTIFIFVLILTVAAAGNFEKLRNQLVRPVFWLKLMAAAGTVSAASAVVAATRHAGTGLATSYGWPKPFYFFYVSETGEESQGFQILYYVGNTLAFASALLVIWIVVRLARR